MATSEETAVFTWSDPAPNDFQTVVASAVARTTVAAWPTPTPQRRSSRAPAPPFAAHWPTQSPRAGTTTVRALCRLLREAGVTGLSRPSAVHRIWRDPAAVIDALRRSSPAGVGRNEDGPLHLDGAGGPVRRALRCRGGAAP